MAQVASRHLLPGDIGAIFFDVAHTLLEKPAVIPALHGALARHGIKVPVPELLARHRLLMEATAFPDRTSRDFYADFNAAVVRAVGAIPTDGLLDEMYSSCSYQPWAPYSDACAIDRFTIPRGILSNWDSTLADKLATLLGIRFDWVLGSEEQRVRKPDSGFFRLMLDKTGLAPGQIAYVGDSLRLDIEPALRMGFHAILLDRDHLYPHSPLARITSLDQLGQRP
jgi:FMN phosphatase YigB (HAD superfamily)